MRQDIIFLSVLLIASGLIIGLVLTSLPTQHEINIVVNQITNQGSK